MAEERPQSAESEPVATPLQSAAEAEEIADRHRRGGGGDTTVGGSAEDLDAEAQASGEAGNAD